MNAKRFAPLILLALAACGSEPKPTGGSADGEILPGSISDAMLPLDTVRSQPPLAPKAADSGKSDAGKPEPKQTAPKPAATPRPADEPAATAEE